MPTLQELATSSSPIPGVDPSTLVTSQEDQEKQKPTINPKLPVVSSSSLAAPSAPPTSFPATGTLSQLSDKPVNPDDILKKAVANSPDPAETDARMQVSKALGEYLKVHPSLIHDNFPSFTQALFGENSKGQTAISIGQRLQNTVKQANLQGQLGQIGTLRFSNDTPELEQRAKDIKAQMPPPEQQLAGAPARVLNFIYSLGYTAVKFGEATADLASAGAAWLAGKMTGNAFGLSDTAGKLTTLGAEAAGDFEGQWLGNVYQSARDRGLSRPEAQALTYGLAPFNAALMTVQVGKIPGATNLLSGAVQEGIERVVLNGSLDSIAGNTLKRLGGTAGTQFSLALMSNVANVAAPEIMTAINNRLEGTKIPLRSIGDILGDIGLNTALQGGMFTLLSVPGAIREGSAIHNAIVDAAVKIDDEAGRTARAEEAVKAQQEVAKAPPEPEHPITAAEKEAAPTRTIGDILDNEPSVPKVTPEATKTTMTPEEEMLAANTEPTVEAPPSAESSLLAKQEADAEKWLAEMNIPKKEPEAPSPEVKIGDIKSRLTPLNEKMTADEAARIDSETRSDEGSSEYVQQHPEVEALSKEVEDLQAKIERLNEAEKELKAQQKLDISNLKDAHAEKIGEIRDQASQKLSDVRKARDEAKAAAWKERLQTIKDLRDNYTARLDAAKAAIPAAKKALRAQIRTRAQVNKDIATIKDVAKGIKTMNRDLGEAARALVEKIELKGKTGKADQTEAFLSEMTYVHKAFADALNDPDQMSHISPFIDIEKLRDLASFRARDISPEDLHSIVNALKNLQKAQAERNTIRNAGLVLQMKDLEKQAKEGGVLGLKLKPEEGGAPETAGTGIRDTVGLRIRKAWRDTKGAVAQVFSGTFNAFLAFAEEGDLFKIIELNPTDAKLREEPHAQRLKAPVMEDWVKENLGIDPKRNTIKWANYLNERFEEDGITLTKDEILFAYKDSLNEKNWKSRLSGSGISSSTTPEVFTRPDGAPNIKEGTFYKFFAYLTPKEKELIFDLSARELDKAGDERGTEFETRFGIPMTREPPGTYWPKYAMNVGKTMADSVEEFRNNQRLASAQVGDRHSIERTNYSGPTYLRGFFKTYEEIMNDTAHVVEMGPVVGPAAKALNNPVISDIIKTRRGAWAYKEMVNELKAKSGQDMQETVFDKAAGYVSALNTAMNLTVKIKTPIKQALLGSRSANMVHEGAFFKALLNVALHYKETAKMDRAISMISDTAQRRGGTIEQYQMTAGEGLVGTGNTILQKAGAVRSAIKKAGMYPVRKGTAFAYTLDGAAAIAHTEIEIARAKAGKPFLSDDFRNATGLDEEQARNLSPEDALKAAGRFGDAIKGQTHAGAAPGYRLGIQKNKIVGAIFQYKTEPFKGTESVVRSIISAHRNPTPFNVRKAIKTTLYYAVVEGAMMYGLDWTYNKLFGDKSGTQKQQDEKDPKTIGGVLKSAGAEVIRTDFQQLPGGSMGTALVDRAEGRTGGFSGTAATQLPENLLKVFDAISKASRAGATDKDKKKANQQIIDYGWETGLAALTGVNVSDPVKIFRGIKQRMEQ
jgi:hypothetical protein